MKNKLTLTAVAALLVAASPAYALSKSQVASIKAALNVPAPEMPSKAVELVKAAPAKEREDVALTAVRTVVAKHPGAAPVVVGAISREMPELSAAVAKAAVQQAPDQKAAVSKAASEAAPAHAAAISTGASQASANAGRVAANVNAHRSSASAPDGNFGNAARFDNPVFTDEVAIRDSANHGESHKPVIKPGPIKYHKPLPVPPRRPITPPGLKNRGPRTL